jgi:HK97 family phage portal protein
MNIFSRLRKAISGIDNPMARAILFGLSKTAVWTPADYEALSKAGYENCTIVYACVNLICRAAAGIEWTAKVGTKKDAPDHPILALLKRPNEDDSRRTFITKAFSFYLLNGNRYILAGRIGKQPPLALWVPRPDRMKVLPGSKGQLAGGYEYRVGAEPLVFDPSLVLHSKLFHPTNDFYGLSPLSVASHAVDISNMAAEWNARLLQNDMRPPGALSTEGGLSDAQYLRLKERMKTDWQGYENAGQPILLEGGLKWVNFMLTAKEMDWLNTTKYNRRDICSVFNVDPCLVGDSEYATYSNKIEARRGLYEDNVLPLMDELCDDLNFWLAPTFGGDVVLGIDKDKIPALQENREKVYGYLSNADFLSLNEKRIATGHETWGPEGDVILISAGKIPLENVGLNDPAADPNQDPGTDPNNDPNKEPDPKEDPAGDDSAGDEEKPKTGKSIAVKATWSAPERKRALWDNFVLRVETKERAVVALAKTFLKAQAARVGKTRSVDVKAEAAAFAKTIRSWAFDAAKRAGAAGMRASKGELPELEEKVDLFNLTLERRNILDNMILRSGTKIAESTMKIVEDLLKNAEVANLTTEELTQKLIEKLDEFAQFRCRRIARTETAKVENWGQLEGYKDTEYVTGKGWMCSFVEESRDAHMDADGQEVGLNEDFNVGGAMMAYPGDPKGDAGNVVNCLCSSYPIVGD